MRGYRLNHVSHSENACFKQNLIAFESLWIARTIHAFMMLQHDLRDRPREVYGFKYFVAALGMLLDDAEFQYVELSRLAENFGWNSNLANIMHDTSQMHTFYLLLRKLQLVGNGNGEFCNAALMACGIGIAHFDDRGHRRNRVEQTCSQPFLTFHQLGCARIHQLLQMVAQTIQL